jgi:phage gpG-like protein
MYNSAPIKVPFIEFQMKFKDFRANKFPRLAAREALKVFDENFDNGGFTNKIFIRWKPRKDRDGNNGRKLGDGGKQQGRALLIKTGRLRRSLRIGSVNSKQVKLVAGNQDVDYAGIHNQGGTITGSVTVKAHTRNHFEIDEVSKPGARKPKYVKISTGSSQVKAHTRKMNTKIPRRQFMGASEKLNDRVARIFFNNINRLWQA